MVNMKDTSVDNRPNIGIQDMENYENGGLCVEELHTNGVSVYIPYGVYDAVFDAMSKGIKAMSNDKTDNVSTILKYKGSEAVEAKILVDVLENTNKELAKSINVLESIISLNDDI